MVILDDLLPFYQHFDVPGRPVPLAGPNMLVDKAWELWEYGQFKRVHNDPAADEPVRYIVYDHPTETR
jgi:hypothetical protein